MPTYPPEISVEPLAGPIDARIGDLPGSKSITNRALVVAALADGDSLIEHALDSDDTRVMVDSLRRLGYVVETTGAANSIRVVGRGGVVPAAAADLFVENSGTSLRFLVALAALGHGTYRLDGVERMRARPVEDLLLALNRLGAEARSEAGTGCPPVVVAADGLEGGYTEVSGAVSSQFLSGLLMALPRAKGGSVVEVRGALVSAPYIEMTLRVMESFGVRIAHKGYKRFHISPQSYQGRKYTVEPDASAASYWFAMAAVAGGSVTVDGLGTTSIQGDMAFVDLLEHMGCRVERAPRSTTVTGAALRGIDVDMNAISDTVMTLAVVALFADGVTRIRNVGHIRHKETDRIAALANELRKLGAAVEESPDGLVIVPPNRIRPARIQTYEDHRMAMSFALASLRVAGIAIENPGCVAKTYPLFWDHLTRVRQGESETPCLNARTPAVD